MAPAASKPALHFIEIVDDERPMTIADEGDRPIPAAMLQKRQLRIALSRTQGDRLSKIPALTLPVDVVLDDPLALRERARNRQHKGFPNERQQT